MKAERTILLLALMVWVAGFMRPTPEGGHVRRSFGILVATVMLTLLAQPAPRLATGLAGIMALGMFLSGGDSIAGTINRALGQGGRT